MKEKPTIRSIDYKGLSSVSQSDVLERFKDRKVGLSQESPYDPTKVKKAEVVLKELLAEHGRQFATIQTQLRTIPPAAVGITFVVKEGPKVKVGKIEFEGNTKVSDRALRISVARSSAVGCVCAEMKPRPPALATAAASSARAAQRMPPCRIG